MDDSADGPGLGPLPSDDDPPGPGARVRATAAAAGPGGAHASVGHETTDSDGQDTGSGPGGDGGLAVARFHLDPDKYSQFVRLGRAQYDILQSKGLDSPCWRAAVASMGGGGCGQMGHSKRQRLAVKLANCHLQDAGRRPSPCPDHSSDAECLSAIRGEFGFGIYTEFFQHVESACYALESRAWREETESLVQGLAAASMATFDRAEQSLRLQEQVLDGQEAVAQRASSIEAGLGRARQDLSGIREALAEDLTMAARHAAQQEVFVAVLRDSQAQAARQAETFVRELATAREELREYMSDMEEDRRIVQEQNSALSGTIGFIFGCLERATEAWTALQSASYLILGLNVCWVLTTVPSLRSARAPLFGLLAAALAVEWACKGGAAQEWAETAGLGHLAERFHWQAFVFGSPVLLGAEAAATQTAWDEIHLQAYLRWAVVRAGLAIILHSFLVYHLPWLGLGRLARGARRAATALSRVAMPVAAEAAPCWWRQHPGLEKETGQRSLAKNTSGSLTNWRPDRQRAAREGRGSERGCPSPTTASRAPTSASVSAHAFGGGHSRHRRLRHRCDCWWDSHSNYGSYARDGTPGCWCHCEGAAADGGGDDGSGVLQ